MYFAAIAMALVVIAFTYYLTRPRYKGNVRFSCSYTSVVVNVADPGRIKRYEWHSAPGRRLGYSGTSRFAADDIRRNDYPIRVVKLVRLVNRDVKAPAWIERRPARTYGLWERLTRPGRLMSSSVVKRIPYIPYPDPVRIPIDNRIRDLIFILNADREETGWRVLLLAGKDLEDAYQNGIFIPDLLTLPALETSPQRQEYMDAWMTAEDERRREERLIYSQ